MYSETLTLYKLMVLYMMKKVTFPLTNAQISEFFLDKEYTNYFTLQQVFSELRESKLINVESTHNTSIYEITKEGESTLEFFQNRLSDSIIQDIDDYMEEHKFELRSEVGIISDYYKSTNHDYIAHCMVKEGKSILIELNISVPSAEEAESICNKWKVNNQEIYEFVMRKLL